MIDGAPTDQGGGRRTRKQELEGLGLSAHGPSPKRIKNQKVMLDRDRTSDPTMSNDEKTHMTDRDLLFSCCSVNKLRKQVC